jgi:predicted NACHT family NTPase
LSNKLDLDKKTVREQLNNGNPTNKALTRIFSLFPSLGYENWGDFEKKEECTTSINARIFNAGIIKKTYSELESSRNDLWKSINGEVQKRVKAITGKGQSTLPAGIETYLKKNLKDNQKIQKVYVELMGQSYDFSDIENIATEIKEVKILEDFDDYDEESDEDGSGDITYLIADENVVRTDSVLNIASDTQAFVLIGIPGSGKTKTLEKILFAQSEKILAGYSSYKIPIFIESHLYEKGSFFISVIEQKLSIDNAVAIEMLTNGAFQLLIDGLNEVSEMYKAEAVNHLKSLIERYPANHFIITTRKFGFTDPFQLPVFELKSLERHQIDLFIEGYLKLYKKTFDKK